jgi:hypothetical protein
MSRQVDPSPERVYVRAYVPPEDQERADDMPRGRTSGDSAPQGVGSSASSVSSAQQTQAATPEKSKTPNKDKAEERIADSWFTYAVQTVTNTVKYIFNKIWSYISALFCCNNPVSNLEEFLRLGMEQYDNNDRIVTNADGDEVTQAKEAAAKFVAAPDYYIQLVIDALLTNTPQCKKILEKYGEGMARIGVAVVELRGEQIADKVIEAAKAEITKNKGQPLTDSEIKSIRRVVIAKAMAPMGDLMRKLISFNFKNLDLSDLNGVALLFDSHERDVIMTVLSNVTDTLGIGNGKALGNVLFQLFSLVKPEDMIGQLANQVLQQR